MMRDKKIGPYSNKAMEESGLFTEGLMVVRLLKTIMK